MSVDYSQPLRELRFVVDDRVAGLRLDAALVRLLPHRSRNFFQKRIQAGGISVNGQPGRHAQILHAGDTIVIDVALSPSWVDPESIPLDVLAEGDGLVVLNKQPGQVVHPTGGIQGGTLLNALHARHRRLERPRDDDPRVIHRLDADTSGVIAFALGSVAAGHYGQLFETRGCAKTYLALLDGIIKTPLVCEEPLGDDLHHEVHVRQAVRPDGKAARSVFEPLANNGATTLVSVAIHSGRLHQIRVHAAHLGHPVAGDPLYNPADEDFGHWIDNRPRQPRPGRPARQLLHAWKLSLSAPDGRPLTFCAPVPADFTTWAPEILAQISTHSKERGPHLPPGFLTI